METPQILVYDKQHYFFRFLKHQFTNINFQKVKKDEDLNELQKYATIVFVMYSETELFDLHSLRSNGNKVLVCTYNNTMFVKMKNLSNIILVDTSKLKIEMVKELRNFFKQFEFATQFKLEKCAE